MMANKTFDRDIILTDRDNLRDITTSYRDITSDGCVGVFGTHLTKSDFKLYDSDDADKMLCSKIQLTKWQFIFRCQTERMSLMNKKPLVIVDLDTEKIHYMVNGCDEVNIAFEKRGVEIRYMKAIKTSFTK